MPHPVYSYREFLGEEFPFRIRVRSHNEYNRVVHAHEHFQLTYVKMGCCVHHIRDKQAVLVKGDFFSVPPYLEHILLPMEGMEFEAVDIDFMPSIINESMQDLSHLEHFFDFAYIQPLVSVDDQLLPKLNISSGNQQAIEALLESMKREAVEQQHGYRLAIKADLLKLLVIAGREFSNYRAGARQRQSIGTHRNAFYEALSHVAEHYTENHRLEDIAARAFMSVSHFSNVFKLVTGTSFIDYLNDIRIAKGMELLNNSGAGIGEIGFMVGFNNLGHFNRMFRKKTGMSPSQYRKHVREKN
ncbi:MAG: hypothetical protein K0R57_5468 [Paenibacillaceae bacterium]|jgi:transcriptional regulator GlxA family with amidase domain|nr:hypothetical protein [Paenibacillaceae bacterium]